MTPHSRLAPLATAIAFAALLAGCQKGDPAAAAVEGADKINAYIACFNAVEQPLHESYQQYIGWMKDPEAGPTGKESQIRGPGTVLSHRVEACGAPMTAALAQQPANAQLDPAAKAYQQRFTALNERIEEAARYYDREDYRRDDAKGMQALHAPLMQAYSAFFEAGEAMDAALERNEDQRRKQQLDAIEKDEGRSAAWYHLKIIGEGKQLVTTLNSDTPDLAAAQTQLTRYQGILEEAQKAKIGDGDPMWGHMERSADKLVSVAARRIERVRNNEPLSRSDQMLLESNSSLPPAGTRQALLASYNDLIDMSNRMTR
ncbi:YiiG family protein [Xanthomonas campestris]|uniref:YiiG family protein n=1 Tax=Xanthomonas campestris TaxID=339 RepID=UPI000E1FA470|nr:YiiG family protein [Xanthomonas campestris]